MHEDPVGTDSGYRIVWSCFSTGGSITFTSSSSVGYGGGQAGFFLSSERAPVAAGAILVPWRAAFKVGNDTSVPFRFNESAEL